MNTERKTRYALKVRVAYDDGQNFMAADVVNISESGLYLETVLPLAAKSKVSLTPLVDGPVGLLEFEGEVVRKKEENLDELDSVPGMGIRFVDVDEASIKTLRDYLDSHGEPTED